MKQVAHIINEETPCTQRMYKQKELFRRVFLKYSEILFISSEANSALKNNIVHTFRSYI